MIQHNFVHLNYYFILFFGLGSPNKTFFLSLKIYGAAVSFFEVLPEEQLTEERKKALQLNDERVRKFVLIIELIAMFATTEFPLLFHC